MQNVYVEWFLLDNALMAYLILKTAAAIARLPSRTWLVCLVSLFSAITSAAAMMDPVFLSIPVKLLLLGLMSLPLKWKTRKQWVRAIVCVLFSTFLYGGMAYALAFFFESDFRGGVLYASESVRAVLIAGVIAVWVPKYITRMITSQRLTRTKLVIQIKTRFGITEINARLDSGHSLVADDAPVIIVDAKAAENTLPYGWSQGCWYECGVPGMGLLPFKTAASKGIMPTLPAVVSWRWEESEEFGDDDGSQNIKPIIRQIGAFWEDSRSRREKKKVRKQKKKANNWLDTRSCRIAVASERLNDCGALVGLDFIELN